VKLPHCKRPRGVWECYAGPLGMCIDTNCGACVLNGLIDWWWVQIKDMWVLSTIFNPGELRVMGSSCHCPPPLSVVQLIRAFWQLCRPVPMRSLAGTRFPLGSLTTTACPVQCWPFWRSECAPRSSSSVTPTTFWSVRIVVLAVCPSTDCSCSVLHPTLQQCRASWRACASHTHTACVLQPSLRCCHTICTPSLALHRAGCHGVCVCWVLVRQVRGRRRGAGAGRWCPDRLCGCRRPGEASGSGTCCCCRCSDPCCLCCGV
jgi:hypothetical protein